MQLSAISLALTRVYPRGGGFSPASLFANSEVGAWYDPSDLTTMFQDRAGTTPVTADGQTVGKILDKSGRGNHAVAPSDAARPLYKTDGTYHWLQFDGVDDSLSTAAIDFTSTDKMSAFVGISTGSSAFYRHIWALGDGLQGNIPGGCWGFLLDTPRVSISCQLTGDVSGYTSFTSDFAITNNTPYVGSFVFDGAGTTYDSVIPVKSIEPLATTWGAGGVVTNPLGTFGNLPLTLGRMFSVNYIGNIYSIILRGALSTTDEITNTETWVNSKTGAF